MRLAAILLLLIPSIASARTERGEHWTKVCAAGTCVHESQDWINYRTGDDQPWQESEDSAIGGTYVLAGDEFTFRKRSKITWYAGCTTCGDKTTIGIELTSKPGVAWLKISFPDGAAVDWEVVDGHTMRWPAVLPNTALFIRATRRRMEKVLRVTGAPGQGFFDVKYQLPEAGVISAIPGGWSIAGGGVTYRVDRGITWDSDGGTIYGPDANATMIDTVTTVQSNDVSAGIRTAILRVSPNDAQVSAALGAGRTVFVDPNVWIP